MTDCCTTCGAPIRTIQVPGADHSSGPVRSTVDPRTALRCTPGCRAPDEALTLALQRAISAGLLSAVGRARPQRCGDCSAPLELPMRATTRAITVEPDGLAPFTVTLSLPVIRCGECGRDNVPSELTATVDRSVRGACGLETPARTARAPTWFRVRPRRGGPGSPAGA
jgi:hypothetical protein